MSPTDRLHERTRQTQDRVAETERLRGEQRLLTAQSDLRLTESRRLIARSEQRRTERAPLVHAV